ncbi:MAG: NAD(P)-dependent glycerol-3-phosphate dehydrogenase [Pseudomonadota bacterium]|nr:MAG: NAD(P)-dependent glycerol-3-phosphate dehydrogenase [Pseudomonadota bacterium]
MAGKKHQVAVLGAGAWGTALGILIAGNDYPTSLWAHRASHAKAMAAERANRRYLPGIAFPQNLVPVSNLAQTVNAARDVLVVVPSNAFRETITAIKPYIGAEHRLSWATKGFEHDTHKLLHEVVAEELGAHIPTAVVSGPTFAAEVAKGMPSAITVASTDVDFAQDLAGILHSSVFRAYTSTDMIGVELGGAVKNVLAIAAGISDGLGFGANARAALITRGLHELMRLGASLGGDRETFMGLAGLGDLILTSTDDQSRNRRFGLAVGRGETMDAAMQAIGVVEGYHATREAYALAREHSVDMPITTHVHRVLHEGEDPHAAVHALLERHLKPENV